MREVQQGELNMDCLFSDCEFQGVIEDLIPHMIEQHPRKFDMFMASAIIPWTELRNRWDREEKEKQKTNVNKQDK
jgi:hypothetical protein